MNTHLNCQYIKLIQQSIQCSLIPEQLCRLVLFSKSNTWSLRYDHIYHCSANCLRWNPVIAKGINTIVNSKSFPHTYFATASRWSHRLLRILTEILLLQQFYNWLWKLNQCSYWLHCSYYNMKLKICILSVIFYK